MADKPYYPPVGTKWRSLRTGNTITILDHLTDKKLVGVSFLKDGKYKKANVKLAELLEVFQRIKDEES